MDDGDPFVALAWPRPDFNGAAHEFLIGLLSTAAAPVDEGGWEDWWRAPPAPDILKDRFDVVAHAFELDGPGARFLQDLDPLEGAEDKEVSALLIDAPGKQTLRNNADLFVKRGGTAVLGRAAAAMALFTMNAYAPKGGRGHRVSLRGGGPLTTLVIANDTLWGRLWPNVETAEQIRRRATDSALADDTETVFPWLGLTRTSQNARETTPVDIHPLQVYWGMPRRVRLAFEDAQGRRCGLTGRDDTVVVRTYRTRAYGINYSEGFLHPLTPYYAPKAGEAKLPMRARSGGTVYRHWPGIVVQSEDKLREPAQVIRQALAERRRDFLWRELRFVAFGFDMNNMKARAWIESETPLLLVGDQELHDWLEQFIQLVTAGADKVVQLLTKAVKLALYDRPAEVCGDDYRFLGERFYRETEQAFHEELNRLLIESDNAPDPDDPTCQARENWASVMACAALRLFDEYAPADGLEERDMHRHVKAHLYLSRALRGYDKAGRSLFDDNLKIASPETATARSQKIIT